MVSFVSTSGAQMYYLPNYQNYNNYFPSSISFSQNTVSLSLGQSTLVTIYGGYNNGYYLLSNSSIVGTGINGNMLSLYANASGGTTLTICSYGSNSCGNLYANVYGNYTYPYQYQNQYQYQYPISLSRNNINMNIGQSQSININGMGNYYMSNIYNNYGSSVVSAYVNGNVLSVYANNPGSSNITVCQNINSCATLYVNVVNNNPYPVYLPYYY